MRILGDGDDDVDQTAQEHHAQSLLPREAEAEADGVGEERIQTHTGGLCVRHIGEQAHDKRADDGRDDGGQEHAAPRHTRLGQDLRVDDDDIGHGEERGQTGHDFSGRGGAALLQMEKLFHYLFSVLVLGLIGTRTLPRTLRRESRLAMEHKFRTRPH